ncbi:MAG: hypothetical protein L0Z50_03500, partial [Verrucomicrobiales bacterium]|nr:hypothetical protein [Verrucomicrobiales bacterium]
MKHTYFLISIILACSVSLVRAARPDPNTIHSDFNSTPDQRTDLVWRNRITGKSQIWYMNGLDLKAGSPPRDIVDVNGVVIANPVPAGGNPDLGWRTVGSGFVDGDTIPDIIWQDMNDKHVAVWYMGGTDGSVMTASYNNPSAAAPGWRLVGVGYFNDDAVLDLLWENVSTPGYVVG